MAVLATASATLSVTVDVASVETWYKLQASTAAVPAKPTSANPSGWSTTEPTYDGTATSTLYTCVKTTLTDGAFSWSDVSKSTAYEAAKTAWNKAHGAESAAAAALADSVEFIESTQTGTTASWTGVTRDASLVKGKSISYHLQQTSASNVTLTLTLAGGGVTDAIPVFMNTTRVGTHYAKGSIVNLTYDGAAWRSTEYWNSNTYDRTLYAQAVKAASAGYTGKKIICGTVDGYINLVPSASFDLAYPLLWYDTAGTTTIASGKTANNHYLNIPNVNFATAVGTVESGAAYKTLYLKGTVEGQAFTVSEDPCMTTSVPESEDGLVYLPLGVMNNATNGRFVSSSTLYAYRNGAFQPVSWAAQTTAGIAQTSADNATAAVNSLSVTTQAALEVATDNINMTISKAVKDTNDLITAQDARIKTFEKSITIDQYGLTIQADDSPIKANLDNAGLSFKANEQTVMRLDAKSSTAEMDRIKQGGWQWFVADEGKTLVLDYFG